ncbi:MAG: KH domain-containing protein [Candidatus Nanohaloarchaeota archaeon QJJ-7]|nr:KH domain-containing protein [Candidatus Nanohaloarchaeota archaeon QJJ-7]
MRHLRIPEERVSVLIGEDGQTLEEVQDLTGTDIDLDDGKVEIEGEPLEEIRAFNIVKAIGRGFSPDRALRLLEDNTDLCVIDMSDFAPTDNAKERLKGRVIGRDGETRAKIENDTDTEIAVYGKTVSILGNVQNVQIARESIRMLLDGRSHSTAYQYIEKNRGKIVE